MATDPVRTAEVVSVMELGVFSLADLAGGAQAASRWLGA
jgi:hypothetical protein